MTIAIGFTNDEMGFGGAYRIGCMENIFGEWGNDDTNDQYEYMMVLDGILGYMEEE